MAYLSPRLVLYPWYVCMYLLLTKYPSIVLSTSRKSRTVSTYKWDLRPTREERGRSEGKYVGKNLLSYFRIFVQ